MGGSDESATPVTTPRRRPRRWRGREVSDISLLLVAPTAAFWLLCLTSPGRSMSVGQGAVIALVFTALWVPVMWVRIARDG